MKQTYIFFADGLEEIEGLTVVDLMRRAGLPVTIVSISDSLVVTGSHDIRIKADALFKDTDFSDGAMFVLPGGMPGTTHLAAFEPLRELLVRSCAEGKYVAAICAAPSVLGDLGLLKGKKAVCYPGFEDKLTDAAVGMEPAVVDGNIITSRGMGTAIDFSGELIALLAGRETARKILSSVLHRSLS